MAKMKIYQSKLRQDSSVLAYKLQAANEVCNEIELLKQDLRYLSEEHIAELRKTLEDELDEPLKILNEIGDFVKIHNVI